MKSDFNSYLTIEEILADVAIGIGDPDMRIINIGFYKRQIKEALRKLNYETKFDWRFQDLDLPANLMLPFPEKGFNIIDIFIYNPLNPSSFTTDDVTDCCGVINPVRVFWKAGMATKGYGSGYTAKIKPYQSDPFYQSYVNDTNLYFYNIQGGMIMLSPSCTGYEKARIYYNGDACDRVNAKIISPLFREGITMFAIEKCLYYLKNYTGDPKYRVMWSDAKLEMVEPWRDCKYFAKRMDTKERNDWCEYASKMPY